MLKPIEIPEDWWLGYQNAVGADKRLYDNPRELWKAAVSWTTWGLTEKIQKLEDELDKVNKKLKKEKKNNPLRGKAGGHDVEDFYK